MNLNSSEIDPDWNKVQRDLKKVGQKDGISAGRDLNFQASFDVGYKDGFKNGFELGKLKFQRENCRKLKEVLVESLENTDKTVCVLCSTEKDNENVADVRKKQAKLVAEIIAKVDEIRSF
ncbi:hypothetical protein ABEB36_002073 [Hypothenemus hampei]|uniref:Essential protein Yae1 N-terminal domain-containing protein n=1 Tax=Hypothenemus hampei TaxID=57062 RepID=A0ABD1F848_HYPHA